MLISSAIGTGLHRWLSKLLLLLLLLLLAVSVAHRRRLPTILRLPPESTSILTTATEIHLRRWLGRLVQIVIAGYAGSRVDGLEASIGRHVALVLGLSGHYL